MAHKILSLLAVTSLAIVACSFGVEPVNAVSTTAHQARGLRGHDALAKRKRSANAKRCKVRPSSSSSADDSSSSSTDDSSSSSTDDSSTWTDSSTAWTDSASSTPAPSSTWSSSSSTWSSTAPSSTAPASGNSGSGSGKSCLAWPNGDQPYLGDYKTSDTSLIYTWSEAAPSSAASFGFSFAPQLWGWTNAGSFQKTVVAGYANYALFLNEPNEPGQSNIDATTAAGMWKTYMEPLKSQGYTLVSAATSSNPNGVTWMQDFFAACNGGCSVDIIATHWYDISWDGFVQYIENWHNTFNLPIWLTEFAWQDFNGNDQGDMQTIQTFMSNATGWMDSQDYVQKYCWFGAMLDMQNVNPLNSLMNPDGSPSNLGNQYLSS